MKKKIVGIFVCILMIVAAVLPVAGTISKKVNLFNNIFENQTGMEFAPGEFIVKLKKQTTLSVSSFEALNEKHQVYTLENMFPNSENTILDNIYLLHVPLGSDILSIVRDYASCPDVAYAEPNVICTLCGIPNDINFSKQWYLHNTGQEYKPGFYGTPDADIDAPEAWDIETGSPDVVIAIIDTGIDYTHPDLAANIWNNTDEIPNNGIDDDQNGYIDDVMGWDFVNVDNNPKDGYGHGTICAGTVGAATNNGIGVAGVCWNCKIMNVQVFNETYYSTMTIIAAGIKYAADNDANIISMSLGTYTPSNTLRDAVNYAYGKGAFLCASAGNNNKSSKLYPAAYENVTAVAGTNQNDSRCTEEDWWPGAGSNYGDWVDIAGPANFIYSTTATYHVYLNNDGSSLNYEYCRGTSFSCPIVAGVAALLLSKDSLLIPDEVKALLCGNVDPYNSTVYIGTGRVNAQKALYALTTRLPPDTPTITGEIKGEINTLYNYTIQTTDPEQHEVKYQINWGDNTTTITGLSESGEEVVISHTWTTKGTYNIQVKAIDKYGAESDSATLTVTMPYSYDKPITHLFEGFFQRFPNAFPLLRHLMGY